MMLHGEACFTANVDDEVPLPPLPALLGTARPFRCCRPPPPYVISDGVLALSLAPAHRPTFAVRGRTPTRRRGGSRPSLAGGVSVAASASPPLRLAKPPPNRPPSHFAAAERPGGMPGGAALAARDATCEGPDPDDAPVLAIAILRKGLSVLVAGRTLPAVLGRRALHAKMPPCGVAVSASSERQQMAVAHGVLLGELMAAAPPHGIRSFPPPGEESDEAPALRNCEPPRSVRGRRKLFLRGGSGLSPCVGRNFGGDRRPHADDGTLSPSRGLAFSCGGGEGSGDRRALRPGEVAGRGRAWGASRGGSGGEGGAAAVRGRDCSAMGGW